MILQDILDQAGVTARKVPGYQYEVKLQCPFCFDDRFIFGLNLQNGWAHCFHCGYKSGSLLKTVRDLCDIWQIEYDLHSGIFGAEEMSGKCPENKCPENVRAPAAVGMLDEYETFSDYPDEIELQARAYLDQRKVSLSQIQQHCIGFAGAGQFAWRILFPVFGDDGEVYGTVGRDFSGQQKPKYLNTPGIKLLWNAHSKRAPNKIAVVVEGIMDALAVERALDSTKYRAVARLGSTLTPVQIEQLKLFQEAIIFPDFDPAGVQGAIKLGDSLRGQIKTSVILPEAMNDTDPGQMSEQQIREVVSKAETYNKFSRLRLRMIGAGYAPV